jgi:hypothetical protein
MQRQQPVLAELGVPHGEQSLLGVEVGVVEADDLTQTHPGDREQPDHRGDGGPPKWRRQLVGGGDQRGDLGVAVQVRDGPVHPAGHQTRWRHFVRGVDGVQVAGEAAHHAHPHSQPASARGLRQPHPGQRVRDRDLVAVVVVEPVEELVEQLLIAYQPIPQAAPQREVVGKRRTQRGGHRAPPVGQGRASARSLVVSAFA